MAERNDNNMEWEDGAPVNSSYNRIAVALNRRDLFISGLRTDGTLAHIISYRNIPDDPGADTGDIALEYKAIGSEHNVSFLDWTRGPLALDDELTFRVLTPGPFDGPGIYQADLEAEKVFRSIPWHWPFRDTNATLLTIGGRAPRFEVRVNNKRACIAGIEQFGVLTIILRYSPFENPEGDTPITESDILGLDITAIDDTVEDGAQIRWHAPPIAPGDTITLRVLKPGPYDAHHEVTPR